MSCAESGGYTVSVIAAGGWVGAGLFVMLMIVIAACLARIMARRGRP
jgi:hypothetical protein